MHISTMYMYIRKNGIKKNTVLQNSIRQIAKFIGSTKDIQVQQVSVLIYLYYIFPLYI